MMRRFLVAAIMAASAAISFGQAVGGGGVPGAGGSATLPTATAAGQQLTATAAGTTYAAQSKIALDPRDFGADFNGASVADASSTSGSNVITCPNSDCNFPSTITGYIIFATDNTASPGNCLDNPSVTFGGNLQTTVASFTNANSITVTGNSNTTSTAHLCLAWFPKDSTTALNAWWAAGGCTGTYQMPAGKTLFSAPIMQNIAGCPGASVSGLAYPGQTIRGAGIGATYLMPAPVFTYTSIIGQLATNCAVGNTNIEDNENFAVFGLGERATATMTNTCLFMVGQASRATNIDLVGWDARGGGTGPGSLIGAYVQGIEAVWMVGGSNFFGSVEMYFANFGQYVLTSFTSGNGSAVNGICGFKVAATGQVTVVGNGIAVCTDVEAGGVLTSTGSQFIGAPTGDTFTLYANGGRIFLLGNDQVEAGGLDYSATGSAVYSQGAIFSGLTGASGSSFFDNGGNTFNGTTSVSGLTWPQNMSAVGVLPATGNIVYGAGFGTGPTSTAFSANGDERHFTYTLTVGTGTQTQATSTITYTFPRAFQVAPGSCHAQQIGGTQAPLTFFTTTLPTTTSVVFTLAPSTAATASATIILAIDCQ